jgi:hypothetical protein
MAKDVKGATLLWSEIGRQDNLCRMPGPGPAADSKFGGSESAKKMVEVLVEGSQWIWIWEIREKCIAT